MKKLLVILALVAFVSPISWAEEPSNTYKFNKVEKDGIVLSNVEVKIWGQDHWVTTCFGKSISGTLSIPKENIKSEIDLSQFILGNEGGCMRISSLDEVGQVTVSINFYGDYRDNPVAKIHFKKFKTEIELPLE